MQRQRDTDERYTREPDFTLFDYKLNLLHLSLLSLSNIFPMPADTGIVRTASAVNNPSILSRVSGFELADQIIRAARNNHVNTASDGSEDN